MFAIYFMENNGLKIIFKYLEIIIGKALTVKNAKPFDNFIDIYIIYAIANLSEFKISLNQQWKEINAINILFSAGDRIKENKKNTFWV